MTTKNLIARAFLTSSCLFALTPAFAADLPPIYTTPIYESAPELQPVEIGNGWYLRGDVGYNFSSESGYHEDRRFLERTGGRVGVFDEDATSKLSASVGAGYQFTDWLRGDVTAEWLSTADVSYDGTAPCFVDVRTFPDGEEMITRTRSGCRDEGSSDLDIYNYMANAYVDLGTVSGFTPYVGAGIGVANVQSSLNYKQSCNESEEPDVRCVYPPTRGSFGSSSTIIEEDFSDSTWQLSYALMAGASYAFNRSLSLDVGYRYLSVPEVDMFGTDFDDGFDMHQIRAGVRYSLW